MFTEHAGCFKGQQCTIIAVLNFAVLIFHNPAISFLTNNIAFVFCEHSGKENFQVKFLLYWCD